MIRIKAVIEVELDEQVYFADSVVNKGLDAMKLIEDQQIHEKGIPEYLRALAEQFGILEFNVVISNGGAK